MKDHKNKRIKLSPEVMFLRRMIRARGKQGLTQTALAGKVGVKQPMLSRLEKRGFERVKIKTLKRITEALDADLIVRLKLKERGTD